MSSITLIALPPRGLGSGVKAPSAALGHIVPTLTKDNIKVVCYDMNIDIFEDKGAEWYERALTWGETFGDVESDIESEFIEYLENYITEIKTEWVGISVFSVNSEYIVPIVCKHIRNISNAKIVAGGYGCNPKIGPKWKQDGIIDNYILGEGEGSLNSLILGEKHNCIDGIERHEVENLDELPIPDYSLFVRGNNKKRDFTITASRGCVRKCTFCNVPNIFPKFRWKKGEKIAEEMIDIIHKYNPDNILFSDSLINGNMKEFRKWTRLMTEYYNNNPDVRIVPWAAQFICRNSNAMTKEDFDYIKSSGCFNLQIGIESGSESVREHMGKKFNDDDMYYTLGELAERNIDVVLLMIVGYPTETEQDHEDTVTFLENVNDWFGHKSKFIVNLNVMKLLSNTHILHQTELYKWNKKQTDFVSALGTDWVDRKERFFELYELIEFSKNLVQAHPNPEKYKMLKKYDRVV